MRGFVLRGFDRATEELKIELHLQPVPLDRPRSLFNGGDDFELYDAHPLDAATAGAGLAQPSGDGGSARSVPAVSALACGSPDL